MEMNTGGHVNNATEARTDSPQPQWQDEPGTADSAKQNHLV